MFEITQVTIEPATRAAVLRMLKACGRDAGREAIIGVVEEALQGWLKKAACDDARAAHDAARGYQWKSLFLPEGTCLRFSYKGTIYDAQVRGDELVYQGRAYSPRQLLLHVTGTVRNAWRELWLRGPGDARWHLADTRRHILRRTARGKHRFGADLACHHPAAPAAPHGLPAPSADQAAGAQAQRRFPESYARAAALRAILYRDDLVRPDQPDLANPRGGGGRCQAGRAGPRDRRYGGYLFDRGFKLWARTAPQK